LKRERSSAHQTRSAVNSSTGSGTGVSPLLRRSKGAIVNNLSLVSLAALPVIPAYSISKAAAFNMTQSLRALLAGQGVTVHAVVLGPIDTDMNRGFEIPKASPESAAQRIFDGLDKGEDDIFPDPRPCPIADGWRNGAVKALERQFAAFVPKSAGFSSRIRMFQRLFKRMGLLYQR